MTFASRRVSIATEDKFLSDPILSTPSNMTTDFLKYVGDVLTSMGHDSPSKYTYSLNRGTSETEIYVEKALQQVLRRQLFLEKELEKYQNRFERKPPSEINTSCPYLPLSSNVDNGDCEYLKKQREGHTLENPTGTHLPTSISAKHSEAESLSSSCTSASGEDYEDDVDEHHSSANGSGSTCLNCMDECTDVAIAITNGDLSKRIICTRATGSTLALKNAINGMADRLEELSSEVLHVGREMAEMGKLCIQGETHKWGGSWKEMMINLNRVASSHSEQVRDIAEVCTAVARGDLSKKISVDVKGETFVLKNTINTMVDQLNSFASEVTRVAHEVGTEGKLGVQAEVPGVDGTWKLLTDNVNLMASNLTAQVRDIANVSKAVARGDLSKKVTVDVKGEIHELKTTINTMVDQLQTFATEVTRVSLEVGTEGKLGGQAVVKDVGGTWK
ncbi:histidine kinase osmosensor, partial [Basidiobolus ranarum]